MDTSVEPLEDNKVQLHVAVPAAEFEPAIDAAFRKLAHEVRIPGFRPGKAPRRLLEARLGTEVAREQALRDALPGFYADAVVAEDIDVIAPPEIDITAGEEDGDVEFDAVVEVRPVVQLAGYDGLRVELDSRRVDDEAVDAPDRPAARPLRRPRGLRRRRSSTATTPRSTSRASSTTSRSTASPPPTSSTRSARAVVVPDARRGAARQAARRHPRVHRRAARALRRAGRRRGRVPGAREGREAEGAARAHRRVGRRGQRVRDRRRAARRRAARRSTCSASSRRRWRCATGCSTSSPGS